MGLTGRGGEGARPLQSTQRRVLSFRDASKRISKRHLSIADALEAAKAQGAKSEAGLVIEHMPLGPDPIPNTQVSDPLAANRDDVAASSPVDPEADERQRDILGLRSVFANLMLYVDAKDSSWFGDVLRWIKHRIFGYGLSRAKVRVAEQVTSQYAADFCAAGEGAENIINIKKNPNNFVLYAFLLFINF